MAGGAVAAGHPETAAAGLEILEAGGSAADAAVAAAFASMVAEASLTGLGAGGFALVRSAPGDTRLFDFFVAAPGKGRSRKDLAARSHLVKFYVPFRATSQLFNVGPSSCAVPGVAPGLATLHDRYGRLPLARIVDPAVRLARSGARLVAQQDYLHDILEGILTESDGMRAIFAPSGRLLRRGELLRMPHLADTLETLGDEGAEAVRTGSLARRMVAAIDAAGGLLTEEDLATYQVLEREPVRLGYRGLDIATNPLPSSGGTLIAFTLRLLARGEMAGLDEAHRALALVDALAATAAARAEGFDEHVYEEGYAEAFLSEEHLLRHAEAGAFRAEPRGRGDTTHISVIDADGMAVSLTCSCGSGSGVIIPGTGIIMNNMMGEEDLNPGGAFSLPPGARLTSMMAPTIASGIREKEELLLALGSAGSERLRSAIIQTLVNILDLHLPVQEAVDRPRLHVEGENVHLEPGFGPDVEPVLARAGYRPQAWPEPDLFFGGVQAVVRRREVGPTEVPAVFGGGGDSRRGGAARSC